MARAANLIRRNNRWFYNRAYPKDLWPVLGKAPFRRALGTDSLEEAKRRRADAERAYTAAVDAARERKAEATPRPLTETEAVAIVSRWFASEKAAGDAYHMSPGTPPEAHAEALAEAPAGARFMADIIGKNELEKVRPFADKMLAGERINADPASPGYRMFLHLLARGMKELLEADAARLRGDFGHRPTDPIMAAAAERQPVPVRTLTDLEAAYTADREAKWSPSTRLAYKPVFRLLRDVLGGNRDVATITRADGRALFDAVQGLPRGLGKVKALDGLTVPQAVAEGKRLGLPTLSPKSINDGYLTLLSAAFGWAVNEQWLAANPMTGLRVADHVAPADRRDAFDISQLQAIFDASPWRPRDDAPGGDPLRFWGPLLAPFHGLRRGEIAQLNVADVATVNGHDVLLIRPGEGRRIKTANARRMLPIHPELVRMGFLAFVKRQRDAGHGQLFPAACANGRGQWGDGLSDWFTRLVASRGLTGTRLGMHSLRHSYQDALREAGLHGSPIAAVLTGRAGSGGVSDDYGSRGFPTGRLAEAVAAVRYPALDLSHLYEPGA